MPASSIAQLLDYEANYEDALASHFSNVLSGVQVLTPRTAVTASLADKLRTPRIVVAVQIVGTNPNQQLQRSTDNKEYDAHKLGTVSLGCWTHRDNTSQSLQTVRGGARKAMLEATAALNNNTLPFYQTLVLREGACVNVIGAENDEIGCQMAYSLEFAIKPDQWAAS